MTNPNNLKSHFGDTNSLGYPKVPLYELLKQTAKHYPKKAALIYAGTEIRYDELETLSNRFAAALTNLGVVKSDRVALFLPNSFQFIIAYFAILKAGAIVTAINPLHREREVEHQLADSEAKIIVALDSIYPIVKKVQQRTSIKTAIVTSVDEYVGNTGSSDVSIANTNVYAFKDLLRIESSSIKVDINPDKDIAALQYTGGTTGTTKAAMLTHTNLVSNALTFADWIKGTLAKEVFLTALPLSHIYGLTTSLNVPVALAAKIVLLSRFESVKALDAIQRHNVTVFCGVPAMYQSLLAYPELQKFCLSSLRICISGASPLPVPLQKQFMQLTGALLIEGYGLTEASPVTHCNPVDKSLRTVNMGSIGLPLPGTESRIVDSETGTKTLPIGEVGELVVRGPQVMRGYWKNPEETALILRDGWLYTGDLARKDANGYFYLVDRKKDVIKHNGYSVYPRELEDLLYEHPAVKLCAVIGKPDPASGETPKAFIVLKEGATVSEEEIKVFVNKQIALYKAIHEVEFRKGLPLSTAGKVLRQALRSEEAKKNQTKP